jgi:PTS system galactosamine-specific IIB component
MDMKGKLLLTRIDNRLVHGQVGVTWTSTLGANVIVVADDQTARDTLMQKLMASTAKSTDVEIRFYPIAKVADILPHASAEQWIFLVVRTPEDAARLQRSGVPMKSVNVGNMHYSRGKKPLNKKVYVDAADIQALRELLEAGVELYIQDVPGAVREDITERMLAEVRFEEGAVR